MYPGGAGGLGRRLRGGVQHQRPHLLHQRQEHPAADSGISHGQLQRGYRGSRVSGWEQAGPVSRPAGARGRGPLPGSGEPLSLPGSLSSRELPGHRQPLHPAHPAGDGAPQVQSGQATLQRLQVYGQAHQQRVWQEEEVSVMEQLEMLCVCRPT